MQVFTVCTTIQSTSVLLLIKANSTEPRHLLYITLYCFILVQYFSPFVWKALWVVIHYVIHYSTVGKVRICFFVARESLTFMPYSYVAMIE